MGQDVDIAAYRVRPISPLAYWEVTPSSITQAIYKNIHNNGFFELVTSEQTYCEDDELFLADRFVEGTCPQCGYDVSVTDARPYNRIDPVQDARGDQCDKCAQTFPSPTFLVNPRCKRNKSHKITVKPTTHSCLRLDAIQPKLEKWLQAARVKGGWQSNPIISDRGEILEPRLKEGLRPNAITRDLKWGVQVPEVGNADEDEKMKGKVIYVWVSRSCRPGATN